MPTLIIVYQWLMYALMIGLTATCVIVKFLDDAHREARQVPTHKPRRADPRIPTLRPIPNKP